MIVTASPAFAEASYNPYQSLLYESVRRRGVEVVEWRPLPAPPRRSDVVHLHWPEKPLGHRSRIAMSIRLLQTMATIEAHRARGARIVWTAHNLVQHERRYPALEARFRSWLWRRLDGVIYLSGSGRELAEETYPPLRSIPSTVIPHGHFAGAYPNEIARSAARAQLGLASDDCVLLTIGQIRPYKNVPELVRCFGAIDAGRLRLVVAGSPLNQEIGEEIRALAARDNRVVTDLRFIPDSDLQIYLNACDGVVLPYRDVFNSGSAILALSFHRPVLAPAIGAVTDLQETFGTSVVRSYTGDLTPGVLGDFARRVQSQVIDPQANRDLLESHLGWPRIAAETVAFYERVLSLRAAGS